MSDWFSEEFHILFHDQFPTNGYFHYSIWEVFYDLQEGEISHVECEGYGFWAIENRNSKLYLLFPDPKKDNKNLDNLIRVHINDLHTYLKLSPVDWKAFLKNT